MMTDQVKLNNGDMICHLMKVSPWLYDVHCTLSSLPLSNKSGDPKLYLHIPLLVSPLLCTALNCLVNNGFLKLYTAMLRPIIAYANTTWGPCCLFG